MTTATAPNIPIDVLEAWLAAGWTLNMGEVWVSPSQVKTWRDCNRKWGFGKIEKLVEPSTEKQQFGTTGHGHLHEWVTKGTPLPDTAAGNAARQLVRPNWAPLPNHEGAIAEEKIELRLPELPGVVLIAYADAELPPEGPRAPAVVCDYKFTSGLRYALNEEQLAVDPQALIYATDAMLRFNVPQVLCRWLYAQFSGKTWKGNGKRKVEVLLSKSDPAFLQAWAELVVDILAIRDAKLTHKTAMPLAITPTSCSKYGGCPFKGRCNVSPGDKLVAHLANFDRHHSTNAAAVDTPADSRDNVPETKDRPMTEATEEAPQTLMEKIRSMKAKAPGESAAPPAETAPEVTPPVAEEPKNATAGQMLANTNKEKLAPTGDGKATLDAPAEKTTGDSGADPAAPDKPAAENKRGSYTRCALDGCKKKATTRGFCEEHAKPNGATAEQPDTFGPSLVVMIDVAYLKNVVQADGVRSLADAIAPAREIVEKAFDVEHWALADSYVKARAALAIEVGKLLDNMQGVILVDSATPEARDLLDVLVSKAGVVLRGVR